MSRQFVGPGWLPRVGMALVATIALVATAGAQETRISGRILDASDNAPIPSAQVIVTGTTLGAQTSDSGTFSLRVPADAKTFVIRRIGYLAQTITIAPGKSDYQVSLQKDVLRLETQVVTGVATTVASQNSANAVAVVTTQEVNQVPSPTIENSLEGKVPGAIIESNNGGAPGGGLQISIRGVTSINGNAEPLYVVDGVILDNETVNSDLNAINGSGGGQTQTGQNAVGAPSMEDNDPNRIADINPDDIESVEILKGASASAIYGSKASAGVIVITTKKGQQGKAKWTIDGQVGHYAASNSYPIRTFPTLASAQAWYINDKTHSTTPSEIAANNAFIAGIYGGAGDNLQGALFGNSAASYQTNISVTGASGGTQYFLSGLSEYNNGAELNTFYNKQSVRSNVTEQFSNNFTVSANLNYIHDNTQRGVTGNDNIGISPYNVFSVTPAFINLNQQNAAGVWANNPFGSANPFADAEDIQTPQEVSRFIGGGNISWTPWKTDHQSLQLSAIGGTDLASVHDLLYAPPTLQVEQENPNGLPGTSVSNVAQINYLNYSLNATYHNTMASWLDATTSGGFERDRRSLENPVTVGYNLIAGVNAPTVGTEQLNYFTRTEQLDQSFYVQEQVLTLDSRLALTGGLTAERSTNDGDINKFYYYPHYAASYRLPQLVGFLDEIKLRAAYGQSGNLGLYGDKYTPYYTAIDNQQNAIEQNQQLGDPNLKPESSTEMELGFDATMFHSRAQFTATVYQKRITNMLLQDGIAPSLGATFIYENGGELTNQGLELSLQSTPLQMRNGFTWVNTLSYSRNTSVVNALSVPNFDAGQGFGFGSDFLAAGRSATDITNPNLTLANGLQPQIGDFLAGYLVSMGNEITWKSFRIFGMVDYSRGGNTVNLTDLYFDSGPFLYADSTKSAARYAALNAGAEPYVESATYFKVRELSLSYTLPASLVNHIWSRVSSARLQLSGYNLWAIFKYDGLDPEVTAFGNQAIGRGYDVTPYPPARSYYLGINLGL